MIAYTIFPTLAELASLWPAWLLCLGLGALRVYGKYKDRKTKADWRKRMMRRELNRRMASR